MPTKSYTKNESPNENRTHFSGEVEMKRNTVKNPDQPIILDAVGTIRFKSNVRIVLVNGPYDLNRLAEMEFSDDDRNQFAQLIGYSVCGFGELPYADCERVERADRIAEKLKSNPKITAESIKWRVTLK